MKIVIIGGVAGGATAAARLRRLDEGAEIVMFEKDGFISFANCGLPYHIGGEIPDSEALLLQTPETFSARFNVDVRIFSEVTAISPAAKTITIRPKGDGSFGRHEPYIETYDKLILAPGAVPLVPPIEGIESDRVFTVRSIPDVLRIKDWIAASGKDSPTSCRDAAPHRNDGDVGDGARAVPPRTAVIIGGGYIGIEMAENLTKAGLAVTIVEAAEHIIASLDYEMACIVQNYLRKKGIELRLGAAVKSLDELPADIVILAAGVCPDTTLARAAGLTIGKTGAIAVNDRMQTSDENIYAVGDAVEITRLGTERPGHIPLAGPANKQARIAADNICGIDSRYKGTQGSAIVKIFDMTVATTGMTETTDCGKVFTLSASNASYYPGGREMCIKTIFEPETGKILGAQIVGYGGVDKRADILAVAVRAGMTAADLVELELCYAPPFSSAKDPVNFAGYVIENTMHGLVKPFHWHDVAALPRDGSITLLDVRTTKEYSTGNISGFENIPLDSLREKINRLDKTKPVYVHCRSGVRSYLACRILIQNGFDAYNLSGGYWLYSQIAL